MIEKTDNPVPFHYGVRRFPIVLLVDTSVSMDGEPMEKVRQMMEELAGYTENDSFLCHRAEICVMGFGTEVRTILPFVPAQEFTVPTLTAGGFSSMNEGIEAALDTIRRRKEQYRSLGVNWDRPVLILVSDGRATDTYREAAAIARLREDIRRRSVAFYPMAPGPDADVQKLKEYYPEVTGNKYVLPIEGLREALVWIDDEDGYIISDPLETPGEEPSAPPMPCTITLNL